MGLLVSLRTTTRSSAWAVLRRLAAGLTLADIDWTYLVGPHHQIAACALPGLGLSLSAALSQAVVSMRSPLSSAPRGASSGRIGQRKNAREATALKAGSDCWSLSRPALDYLSRTGGGSLLVGPFWWLSTSTLRACASF